MQLILISSPESLPNEIKWVEELFKAGLTRFHLRKPEHSRGHLKEYLLAIDPVYYPRICLHTHLDLAEEFSLGGVHLNGSVRGDQEVLKYVDSFKKTVRLSASAHRLDELGELKGRFEYVFLSPVFDSLSKVGYCAGFDFSQLKEKLALSELSVVALGGCTPGRIKEIKQLGFSGAAFLGYVWQAPEPLEAFFKIKKAF